MTSSYRKHHNGDEIRTSDGSTPGDRQHFPYMHVGRHRDNTTGAYYDVFRLAKRGTHRRWGFTLDGHSQALCSCGTGFHTLCPRHASGAYAEYGATHVKDLYL